MTPSDELLKQILQLSERMLELARGGDWDAVLPLEKERRDLIVDCFAQGNSFRNIERATRRIQKILDMDSSLVSLGAGYRGELAAALQNLQRGRNATQAYHHCGR